MRVLFYPCSAPRLRLARRAVRRGLDAARPRVPRPPGGSTSIDETADTRSFVLDIPPGARGDVRLRAPGSSAPSAPTIGGEPVVRCYSMSSSPDVGDRFTTTVKRVPGGRMSNWMNDALATGRHHRGHATRPGLFVLRETDVPIVAFAGGSGITPVISIVKSALATTDAHDHAGVRQPQRRRGDLRRRAGTAAAHVRRPAGGASSPRLGARLPRRRAVRRAGRVTGRTPTSTSAVPARTWTRSRPASRRSASRRSSCSSSGSIVPADPTAAPTRRRGTESLVIRLERRSTRSATSRATRFSRPLGAAGCSRRSRASGQLRDLHGPPRRGIGRRCA